MKVTYRFLLGVMFLLLTSGFAQASGANFKLTADGKELTVQEEAGEVPIYALKLEVGQTVTLVSQGIVIPRGQAPQPSEPEAAKWTVADKGVQIVAHDKTKFDKTKTPLSIKALQAGKAKVQFAGKILGYDHKFDVLIEITEKK